MHPSKHFLSLPLLSLPLLSLPLLFLFLQSPFGPVSTSPVPIEGEANKEPAFNGDVSPHELFTFAKRSPGWLGEAIDSIKSVGESSRYHDDRNTPLLGTAHDSSPTYGDTETESLSTSPVAGSLERHHSQGQESYSPGRFHHDPYQPPHWEDDGSYHSPHPYQSPRWEADYGPYHPLSANDPYGRALVETPSKPSSSNWNGFVGSHNSLGYSREHDSTPRTADTSPPVRIGYFDEYGRYHALEMGSEGEFKDGLVKVPEESGASPARQH